MSASATANAMLMHAPTDESLLARWDRAFRPIVKTRGRRVLGVLADTAITAGIYAAVQGGKSAAPLTVGAGIMIASTGCAVYLAHSTLVRLLVFVAEAMPKKDEGRSVVVPKRNRRRAGSGGPV
jgi:hypothetical protein